MTVKLEKALKREIQIGAAPYIVTIDPEGLLLTAKGRRKGIQLRWGDLVSGQAALATALNASLGANISPVARNSAKSPPRR